MIKTLALALAAATLLPHTGGHDGPERWEGTTVTVSGVDAATVERLEDAWGTIDLVHVEDGGQISVSNGAHEDMVGAEATRVFDEGFTIGCTIVNEAQGFELLSHEVGHCLGLSHDNMGLGSNMHWFAGDYEKGWSDTVTDRDRAALAQRYQ